MVWEKQDKEIWDLQLLGLTQNQAKVYLALIKFENSTAKAISTASSLAACDIYRAIAELQKLGLIETLIATPKLFRAIPPSDAVRILFKMKEKQVQDLKLKANQFLENIHLEKTEETETSKMALIPSGHRATQFVTPKLIGTKKHLDAVQTDTLFRNFIGNSIDELKALAKKNVEMRFVIESKNGLETPNEDLQELLSYANVKVRFAKNKLPACILLHDDTDVLVSTSIDTTHTPSYWSNNACVIAIVQSYFDTTWQNAQKHRHQGDSKKVNQKENRKTKNNN
jgi:sugar-specific transcriptional regulator TrmB